MKEDCYHLRHIDGDDHYICSINIVDLEPCEEDCEYYITKRDARKVLNQHLKDVKVNGHNYEKCDSCKYRKQLHTGNCTNGKLPYYKCRLGQQTLF